VVLGIGALILLVFAVGAAVSRGGGRSPSPTSNRPVPVHGTSLLAISGTHLLSPLVQPGSPPTNIVRAVTVPQGTTRVSTKNNGGGSGQYDQQVVLSVPASQSDVIAFYRSQMPATKWGVFSTGPAVNNPGAVEVLGKQAGDDGWYWEMGVIVSPTTFAGSTAPTAGTGGAVSETTRFTIRLFQVSDEA